MPLDSNIPLSDLDANDDDERMVSDGYLVRTSTERIDQLEAEHKRTRDLVRVCLRRITDVSLSVDDLKPVVAGLEATVTRWTGGQ